MEGSGGVKMEKWRFGMGIGGIDKEDEYRS